MCRECDSMATHLVVALGKVNDLTDKAKQYQIDADEHELDFLSLVDYINWARKWLRDVHGIDLIDREDVEKWIRMEEHVL